MQQIILDDSTIYKSLYPFTRTRHTADIRVGILTIREKWERHTGLPVVTIRDGSNPDAIPANTFPSKLFIEHPWDIFRLNDAAIREDFELIKQNKTGQPVPESVQVINASQIFVEQGAKLSHCMLNASTGPIYIGKDAEVMEGCFIRGPFALGEGSVVKMASKIYGATTIGPHCVVGGEIKNSVLFGYSNKAHDGYLGDSVLGEWCNLGAGTSNSNLRNTASEVKVWSAAKNDFINAGTKCGLLMGDYSRSAINTSFNTGTVVGVCCNVFGEGLSKKHIPDFTWGNHTLPKYEFEKALKDIANWKKLKNQSLHQHEIQQLKAIFDEL